jgi:glutathione synthase/RimK-type ligase-like ATP-grasp enzyme
VRGAIRARGRPGPPADPIAGPRWFRWFYHRDQRVAGHPFDPRDLERLVLAAAAALGLEIFGGDAIATPSGLVLLDVNAWPSFALYRDEAAAEIAAYLAGRFTGSGA